MQIKVAEKSYRKEIAKIEKQAKQIIHVQSNHNSN